MAADKKVYDQLKLAGFLAYIPLILVTGPVGGYVLGDILEKKCGWRGAVPVCLALFTAASLVEIVRIIKMVARMDKKQKL